jgi:hypothetical protein
MALMVVTEAVLKRGTDCNETQSLNILVMFVTEAVLKRGTDCNELQPANI